VPRPADWGDPVTVAGYWFLQAPSSFVPPPALARFLECGPTPVYVGFGSMALRDAERVTGVVLDALTLSGMRAVMALGWGGLSPRDLPDSVYALESVPHDWLFPRVAAVVHHGGAGTTAAGLRAGVPSVVVPFILDQFFWANRVARLGVGPPAVPYSRLSAQRLARAIAGAVGEPGIRERAAALGARIRAEDGVGKAVGTIERLIAVPA
jgi:UDP:flavonoid glycosyltransferase YjiC (YdhE family)